MQGVSRMVKANLQHDEFC